MTTIRWIKHGKRISGDALILQHYSAIMNE